MIGRAKSGWEKHGVPWLGAAPLALLGSLGGTAHAQSCTIDFDDEAALGAIADSAATTFVVAPDLYQQHCSSFTGTLRELAAGFPWEHYHLLYEEPCIVLCDPGGGFQFALDLSCLDPAMSGCVAIDPEIEPRFLASDSMSHQLQLDFQPSAGPPINEICGGSPPSCVPGAAGELFTPRTVQVRFGAIPIDGSTGGVQAVDVLAVRWELVAGVPTPSPVQLTGLTNGTWDLSSLGVVDRLVFVGSGNEDVGSYGIDDVEVDLTWCGDGILTADEECDDGNLVDGDGCSSTCQVSAVVVADAGEDQWLECVGDGHAEAALDGTGSLGAPPLTFTWSSLVSLDDPTSPTPSGSFPLGTSEVFLTVTSQGISSEDSVSITVDDTTPPVLEVPPDVTTSSCGPIDIGQATATDGCGGPVTITSDRPAQLPIGTTLVTWTARDDYDNVAVGTQSVTVLFGDDPTCCPAGSHVILGTSNNDTLVGTAGSDCILGFGAQDTILGGGGNDYISGGDGDDVIDAGPGNDVVFGGTGQDRLTGGAGADSLSGDDGDDRLFGGLGNDTLRGGQGQDSLYGEQDDDALFGDDGYDVCAGGTGTNQFASCETLQ